MAEVVYSDPAGNTITMLEYEGIPMPSFEGLTDRMMLIKEMKARDDDVIICGYPKSGTHWVWEIAHMLLSGKAEFSSTRKEHMMLEINDPDYFHKLPSPRLINNHLRFRQLPRDVVTRKCKLVYLLRNPKDIAVSHYYHNFNLTECYYYNGDWHNYYHLWKKGRVDYGSWFEYVKDWESELLSHPEVPVFTIHYEELKQNGTDVIKSLSEFLDVSLDDDVYCQINDLCSISKMKDSKNNLYDDQDRQEWRNQQPGMYRKGQIGDWKNHFTVAENEDFDSIYAQEMRDSSLRFAFDVSNMGTGSTNSS